MKTSEIISSVSEYYTRTLDEYGLTPRGVDWNNEHGQLLRFEQLSKIIYPFEQFSVNDIGCGYGAYNLFLSTRYENYDYYGYDISEKMIDAAKEKNYALHSCKFEVSNTPKAVCDYSIASGIFNIKLATPNERWLGYIKEVIMDLNEKSSRGFSFNCLTSYSHPEKMKDHLYYANPLDIFDFCKRFCSINVALLHDYDLYEFTILVKK